MRALLATMLLLAAAPAQDPILNRDSLAAWKAFLRPTATERAAETIAWSRSFHAGLVRAHGEKKPLLLWVMNGHPLGCT